MEHLLFPTDFSGNSQNALKYTVHLASHLNSTLHLFHAFHVPYIHAEMPAGMYQTAIKDAENEAQKQMQELWNKVQEKEQLSDIDYQFETQLGFAVEEILNLSENLPADMIVIGTKGESGITEVLFGSIATNIISKAKCPVLAIPQTARYKDIKNIAFATTYEKTDLDALSKLVELAKAYKAKIHILHVNEQEGKIKKEEEAGFGKVFREKFQYNNLNFDVCEGKDAASAISNYTDTHQVDIISLIRKKRNLFANLFHSSLTEKMASHTKIPLLAFHE